MLQQYCNISITDLLDQSVYGFRLRPSVCVFVGDAAFGNQKVRVVEGTSHINRNIRHLASAIE
jgi:hypothetical protein